MKVHFVAIIQLPNILSTIEDFIQYYFRIHTYLIQLEYALVNVPKKIIYLITNQWNFYYHIETLYLFRNVMLISENEVQYNFLSLKCLKINN